MDINLQYLSNEFLKTFSGCHGKFLKLKVKGKSWNVKVSNYPKSGRLYAGWSQFKEGNKLEFGDICVFELIDEKKFVFEVSIERKHHYGV